MASWAGMKAGLGGAGGGGGGVVGGVVGGGGVELSLPHKSRALLSGLVIRSFLVGLRVRERARFSRL